MSRNFLAVVAFLLLVAGTVTGEERRALGGHLQAVVARSAPLGKLAATKRLRLNLGLPLRNGETLTHLLDRIYDQANPEFRHFVTPTEFAEAFGPTEADYQKVCEFARSHGLTITQTHANRLLVEVEGPVASIEQAFGISLRTYQHPTEARLYHAPDTEPSVPLGVPLLHIAGLDDYRRAQPMSLHPRPEDTAQPRIGSGPQGYYIGSDFRTAYVPKTSLTGSGQSVALVEFDGYYSGDIIKYKTLAKLPDVPVTNILIAGFNGAPSTTGSGNEEVALDIEMAISMAPGLDRVMVYEVAPNAVNAGLDAMLNRIATDNVAKQIGCSWGFDIDLTTQQIFQQFAAQGQSFFLASGDSGAASGGVLQPADNPFVTVVGGTVLTTSAAHAWLSEATWNSSGGGISTLYPLPGWQRGLANSSNRGSTVMRNVPDVAMVADHVWLIADAGRGTPITGTSVSAPLWAGFTALINQQGAANGAPPVGFLNPSLYALAQSMNYHTDFHDITVGNNENANSPGQFRAAAGYDLCTGLGTPAGPGLIEDLLALKPADPLVVTPPLGFTAFGPVAGPFNLKSQTYTLTNTGTAAVIWSVSKLPAWLRVSTTNGTLFPGGPSASVTVSLDAPGSKMLIGETSGDVVISDLTTSRTQARTFNLAIGNGGFETGDFAQWVFSGDTNANYVDSYDAGQLGGSTSAVDDSLFVHTGIYGGNLGQSGSLASLTQRFPVSPGQLFLVSFWLDNPADGLPNRFRALWDGRVLYDKSSLSLFKWTNMQYVVTATGSTASLVFQFQNDKQAFGLDDISVKLIASPVFQNISQNSGQTILLWSSTPGVGYQPQYKTDLTGATWFNLGALQTATSTYTSVTDNDDTGAERYYRVVIGAP